MLQTTSAYPRGIAEKKTAQMLRIWGDTHDSMSSCRGRNVWENGALDEESGLDEGLGKGLALAAGVAAVLLNSSEEVIMRRKLIWLASSVALAITVIVVAQPDLRADPLKSFVKLPGLKTPSSPALVAGTDRTNHAIFEVYARGTNDRIFVNNIFLLGAAGLKFPAAA